MELIIDTSEKTYLALRNSDGEIVEERKIDLRFSQSEQLLQSIDEMIKKNDCKLDQIRKILVNPGPGSYTGLRVGMTTANLLAFTLNIPVFSMKENTEAKDGAKLFGSPVSVEYQNEPIITKPKPRLL